MTAQVLFVDDEEDIRVLSEWILAPTYEVVTAGSGDEVDAILAERHVDVIVLDVRMPGRSGLEVLDDLVAAGRVPPVRVVGLSAHAEQALARRMMDAGACGFVFKPFNADQLLAAVASALEAD